MQLMSLGVLGVMLGAVALDSSCARKPRDKVSYGQNEFLYDRTQILGANSEHLTATGAQLFSRKPFERLDGQWIDFDSLNNFQKNLVGTVKKQIQAKLDANGTKRVKFSANQDYIFLGVEGEETRFFSYVWKVDGFYNYRDQKTQKGDQTGYLEKAQEGHWFDRPMIGINSNTVPVPVKLADNEKKLTFARGDLDNKTLNFAPSVVPNGFTKIGWANVVGIYEGKIPAGATLVSRLVNSSYRLYWSVNNSQGRTNLIEIAHVDADLGYLDYHRDQNNNPSPDLSVISGEAESNDYDFVSLKDVTNPQVFSADALALKEDFVSSKVLRDVPNLEIQSKIKAAIGVSDDEVVSVTFNDLYVFVKVKDSTFRFPITSNLSYVGTDAVDCKQCATLAAGTVQRQPLFVVDSSNLVVVEAEGLTQRVALENALQKADVDGREFMYYPTLVDSTTDDPNTGAGSTPEGYYYNYSQGLKVKFTFEKDFVSAVIVKDERDPTLKDRAILKFPIREHFNLQYNEATKKYERNTAVDWKVAQYADIDFSRSEIPNFFDSVTDMNAFYGVYVASVTEVVEEPLANNSESPNRYFYLDKTPNAPRFLSYLTRITATPNPQYTDPYAGTVNLRPVTMKVRHAFREIRGDEGFKPVVVDRFDYTTFGIFYETKYASKNGLLEDNEEDYTRMASIFNVDPDKGKIVTYNLNKDFPGEYCNEALAAVDSWNRSFQESYSDKRTYVVLAEASAAEAALPEMKRFVGKCVKPDGTAIIPALREVGDVRVNMIVHFSKNMGNGLAGFGPHLSHPETGEVLSASAFMYEGAIRGSYAAAGYLYDYMNMTPEAYEAKSLAWAGPNSITSTASLSGTVARSPSAPITNAVPSPGAVAFSSDPKLKVDFNSILETAKHLPKGLLAAQKKQGAFIKPDNASIIRYFADKLAIDVRGEQSFEGISKKRDVYARIVSQVVSQDSSGATFEASKELLDASLKQTMGSSYARIKALGKASKQAQARSCSFATESVGLNAKDYYDVAKARDPNMTRQGFQEMYAHAYYYDVLVHEMGHNFGLYHNFKASTDKRNYPDLYHDLEIQKAAAAEGDKPLIAAEQQNIRTSSVMDYNPHYQGILRHVAIGADGKNSASAVGPYDRAAIMYIYKGELEAAPESAGEIDKTVPAYQTYSSRIPRSVFRETVQSLFTEDASTYKPIFKARAALKIRDYAYCTNGDQASDPMCATFDSGSNPSEIVKESIDQYDLRYRLNSVNHGAIGFRSYYQGLGSTSPFDSGVASRIRAMFDTYAEYMGYPYYYGIDDKTVVDEYDGFTVGQYRDAAKQGLDYLNSWVVGALGPYDIANAFSTTGTGSGIVVINAAVADARPMYAQYQYEKTINDARPTKRGLAYDYIDVLETLLVRQSYQGLNIQGNNSDGYNIANDPYFRTQGVDTLAAIMDGKLPIFAKLKSVEIWDPSSISGTYTTDSTLAEPNFIVVKDIPDFVSEMGIIYGAAFYNNFPDRTAFNTLSRVNNSCDKTTDYPLVDAVIVTHPSASNCVYSFANDGKPSLYATSVGTGIQGNAQGYSKAYFAALEFAEASVYAKPYFEQLLARGPTFSAAELVQLQRAVEFTQASALLDESSKTSFNTFAKSAMGTTGKFDTSAKASLFFTLLKTKKPAGSTLSLLEFFAGNLQVAVHAAMKQNLYSMLGPDDIKYLESTIRATMKYLNAVETWNGTEAPVFAYAKMANSLKEVQTLLDPAQAPQFYAVSPTALLAAEPVSNDPLALAPAVVSFSALDLLAAGEIALKASGKIETFLETDPFNTSSFDYYSKEGLKSFGRVDLIRHYDEIFNGN